MDAERKKLIEQILTGIQDEFPGMRVIVEAALTATSTDALRRIAGGGALCLHGRRFEVAHV